MLIIIDDKIPYIKGVLEPFADIGYYPGNKISPSIIRLADALIIRTRTKCSADLLKGSSVKFIATATIGYDHIDTTYCQKNGINWTNAAGCNSGAVMQYIASALLTYASVKNIKLNEHVLGVIGAGNVGKKVVRLAESFGMPVVINDPPRERKEGSCGFISVDGILREADIITFHVPLNIEGDDCTFHLANEGFFSRMNKESVLINTSRGEVIDTLALKKILKKGILSSAILDVWENEPFIDKDLVASTFIGTPHIAGYSIDGKSNATTYVVNAVSRFFNFGIEGWEPDSIPDPENKEIIYNASNKNMQEVLFDLVKSTYDIMRDDKLLRNETDNFEKLRENYPFRREFGAYSFKISNLSEENKMSLIRLGFNIL